MSFDGVFGPSRGRKHSYISFNHVLSIIDSGEIERAYALLADVHGTRQQDTLLLKMAPAGLQKAKDEHSHLLRSMAHVTTLRRTYSHHVVASDNKRLHLWPAGHRYIELSQAQGEDKQTLCGWEISTSPYLRVHRGAWQRALKDVPLSHGFNQTGPFFGGRGTFQVCPVCEQRAQNYPLVLEEMLEDETTPVLGYGFDEQLLADVRAQLTMIHGPFSSFQDHMNAALDESWVESFAVIMEEDFDHIIDLLVKRKSWRSMLANAHKHGMNGDLLELISADELRKLLQKQAVFTGNNTDGLQRVFQEMVRGAMQRGLSRVIKESSPTPETRPLKELLKDLS
jgi:hypothetical protein